MRRSLRLAVVAAVPAALVLCAAGCGGPKPINPATPIPAGPPPVKVPAAADKPAASDPQAVALVHAALDAHTNKDRSAVRKFRTVVYQRQGVGLGLENQPTDLKWAVSSAWPDRFRVAAEFGGSPTVVTQARNGAEAWQWAAPPAGPPGPVVAFSAAGAKNLRIDSTGQWLWLLFPLDDPDAMFAPAPPADLDGVSCPGVHLFHPLLAPAAVHFRPDTKLLARVAYEGREGDKAGVQVFQVIETKPYHGVQLAHRLAQSFDGREYANLALVSFDPKAKLDDALFAPPK